MSNRQAHTTASTGFYHVVHYRSRAGSLFTSPQDYAQFLAILRQAAMEHDAPIVAYCLLRHQWHLVVGPLGKSRLRRIVRWVISTHAARQGEMACGSHPCVIDSSEAQMFALSDLGALVPMSRYVERNAKSAGVVARAEDWPWASLFQRVSGHKQVPLRGGAFLASSTWIDYVNSAITRRERISDSHARHRQLLSRRGLAATRQAFAASALSHRAAASGE